MTDAERLSSQARRILEQRATIRVQADDSAALLHARLTLIDPPGAPRWRVVPLGPTDEQRLGHLAAQRSLPPIHPGDQSLLDRLAHEVPRAVEDSRALGTFRRLFTSASRRERATGSARWLLEHHSSWASEQARSLLDRLAAHGREPTFPIALDQALRPPVGLIDRLQPGHALPEVIDLPKAASVIDVDLIAAISLLAAIPDQEWAAREAVLAAGETLRAANASRLLAQMPLERLREATRERLRVNALADAGITDVHQLLARGMSIQAIPGIGEVTARRMLGAAQTLHTLAQQDASITLDPSDRIPEAGHLLARLRHWEVWRQASKATDLTALAHALQPWAELMRRGMGAAQAYTHLAVLSHRASAEDLLDLLTPLPDHAADLARALSTVDAADADPWADFTARPSDYFALLSELGLIEERDTYGNLPEDVIAAVRAQELDASHLTVSLRGYQSFAARFALVQKKVLIGDEMGLGKTIEALAVLSHRASEGGRWFLVIVPASVLPNWTREVRLRTTLTPRLLHGDTRDRELTTWRAEGGVAITTFATLARVMGELEGFEIDALVVDEAHYVKNPRAHRSQRVARLVARTEYVVLLTGTPLENNLGEFGVLVDYLQPDLLTERAFSPVDFRRAVAPVYLRRNTEDVLTELPELIEVDDWLEMRAADLRHYREQVEYGHFMGMRRAAFRAGPHSAKVQRLVEIVDEAEANGRRVLVFSYFREVLEQVATALTGPVFGPLTGAIPVARRQEIIDEFGAAEHGAALVAQMQAGGVGLNIQAASVVVLCEPQLKPTAEWQAIARSRRMGQLESVQVHRLLTLDSVDERLVHLLSGKSGIFHEYAAVSETAQRAPEAFDISEADLARQVVQAEQERLLGQTSSSA